MTNKKSAESEKPPAKDPTEFSVASTRDARPFPPTASRQIRSDPRFEYQKAEDRVKVQGPSRPTPRVRYNVPTLDMRTKRDEGPLWRLQRQGRLFWGIQLV